MIQYSDNKGTSIEDAIRISGTRDSSKGIAAEFDYIDNLHGMRGITYKLVLQRLVEKGKKAYDEIEIELIADGTRMKYYFDISGFYGK